ncbi:MAG: FHA domain-containing protein [bacterium]
MTVALIVTTGGRQTGKSIISKQTFVVGRSTRCDLVLDDKNVSREHAVIERISGRYELRDRGSRNSTILNGVQLTAPSILKEGDRIQIGPFELSFLEDAGEPAQGECELSRTRCMDDVARQDKAENNAAARKKSGSGIVFKLTALDGPLRGDSWANWTGNLTFGRGPDNLVVLQEDVVSLAHARIKQEDGRFVLEDLGSSNGTFLSGTRVRSSRLRNNQRIRIGTSTFVFSVVDQEKKKFILTITAISMVFTAVVVGIVVRMTPEDQVEPLVAQGVTLGKNGEFVRAKEAFENVLARQPDNQKAQKYLRDIDECIEREKILLTAATAAESEQFDKAIEICSKLLIKHPTYRKAKELELIIGKVRDAQTALDARNWIDAAGLLSKAVESYPDSTLLARRLDLAKAERTAQDNLAKARELLGQSQPENAAELLVAIPQTSVYTTEAKELLQGMRSADLLASSITEALALYRRGNIAGSRAAARKGMKLSPGNVDLLAVEKRLNDIEPLWKGLQECKDVINSDDIGAIRRALDICGRIAVGEPDTDNYFRQQADQFKLQLDQALGETERTAIVKADALAKDGNKREAYKFYAQAASINPGNVTLRKTMDTISTEVSADCQRVFREGLVYEETGQTDLAIASYEKVLRIAIDGDRYCERAREKLRQLKK